MSTREKNLINSLNSLKEYLIAISIKPVDVVEKISLIASTSDFLVDVAQDENITESERQIMESINDLLMDIVEKNKL